MVASNGMLFAEEGFILMGAMGALIIIRSLVILVIRQIKGSPKVIPEDEQNTKNVEKNTTKHVQWEPQTRQTHQNGQQHYRQ